MQTEGATKGEGSISWIEKLMPMQTVAEWIKVSRQALNNFSFIAGEIRTKLMRDLQAKVDQQVYDGSGVVPNLKGVYTSADAYTPVAAGITDANIYDLLIKVIEDIAASTSYMPNIAIMNLVDINALRLKKDANNNYIFPQTMINGQLLPSFTIVESPKVAANTMLVGDFDYATLYSEGSVTITIGFENDDFTRNLSTILAEEVLGLLVRDVETDAFRKVDSISAALATLAS
jgi:HK97 family phage major capsid protein